MSPARIDRAFVFWIAATLMVQASSAVLLSSRAFDASATTTLTAVACVLLSIALAVMLPGRLVRLAQWISMRLGLGRIVVPGLADTAGTRVGDKEARAMSNLAAVLAFVAAGCGLLSILAIQLAGDGLRLVEQRFLFSMPAWRLLTFLAAMAAMLPLGLGVSVALLSHTVLRRGSGRDVYAGVFRQWLWAAAAGAGAVALLWWFGANLLHVQLAAVVSLAAAAAALTQRKRTAVRLRRPLQPVAAPSRRRRLALAGSWAALAVALMVQLRLLDALTGACPGGKSAWLGITLALLAATVGRNDARSRPASTRQLLAVCILLPAGLLIQASLALVAIAAKSEGSTFAAISVGVLAAACQLPLAAGAGMVVSAHRRRFASAGRRGRQYISTVAAGCAVGVLGYLLMAPSAPGAVLAGIGALALCAAAVVGFIGLSTRGAEQLRWACWGGVVLLALAAVVASSAQRFRSVPHLGPMGSWLTGGVVRGVPPSQAVSDELNRVLSEHRGRWWVVASSAADIPGELWGVSMAVASPDPSSAGAELRELLSPGAEADFFEAARRRQRRFDGLLLTPLPADHGGAWRCYNVEWLKRSASMVHAGGVVVVRLRGSDARGVLRVASGFAEVVGDGWLAVAESDGGLDVLIAGPAGVVAPPRRQDLPAVSLTELLNRYPQVRPMRLIAPGGVRIPGRGREELLRNVRELSGRQP